MKIDVQGATKQITDAFKDLSASQTAAAISRAINHTLGKAKTSANKHARETYNVKAGDFGKRMEIGRASRNKLWGTLKASNRPMSLRLFNARQTKKGVSFAIKKGERQTLTGVFMKTVGNGFKGIFARGNYVRKGFVWARKRLPVQGLNTVSANTALNNTTVKEKTANKTSEDYAIRLQHEIKRLLK